MILSAYYADRDKQHIFIDYRLVFKHTCRDQIGDSISRKCQMPKSFMLAHTFSSISAETPSMLLRSCQSQQQRNPHLLNIPTMYILMLSPRIIFHVHIANRFL